MLIRWHHFLFVDIPKTSLKCVKNNSTSIKIEAQTHEKDREMSDAVKFVKNASAKNQVFYNSSSLS